MRELVRDLGLPLLEEALDGDGAERRVDDVGLGRVEVSIAAQILRSNTTLTSLKLTDNSMGRHGLLALTDAIAHARPPLREVLMGNLGISSGGEIFAFVQALREGGAPLKVLDVHSNPVWEASGSDGGGGGLSALRAICEWVGAEGSTLERLNMRDVMREDASEEQTAECIGLLCDALWSDPDSGVDGWAENDRGVSFTFGEDRVKAFLERNDLDLIVRAHQVVENGYEFFAERRLVTVFSAPAYCGEFNNAGALMHMDEGLQCSFKILKPIQNDAESKEPLRSGASARPPTPPRR